MCNNELLKRRIFNMVYWCVYNHVIIKQQEEDRMMSKILKEAIKAGKSYMVNEEARIGEYRHTHDYDSGFYKEMRHQQFSLKNYINLFSKVKKTNSLNEYLAELKALSTKVSSENIISHGYNGESWASLCMCIAIDKIREKYAELIHSSGR